MNAYRALVAAALIALPVTAASARTSDILTTAQQSGNLTVLIKAIETAGLSEVLKGPGPFTIFAPSNAAFAKLDPEVMKELMAPEGREELVYLLKAHVVSGTFTAADLKGKPDGVSTKAETAIRVALADVLRAGNAKIVSTDITASNGVIHIVDEVVTPSQ